MVQNSLNHRRKVSVSNVLSIDLVRKKTAKNGIHEFFYYINNFA